MQTKNFGPSILSSNTTYLVAIAIVLIILITYTEFENLKPLGIKWDTTRDPVLAYIETLYVLGNPDYLDANQGGAAVWNRQNEFKVIISDTSGRCLQLGFPMKLFKNMGPVTKITNRAFYNKLSQLSKLDQCVCYDTATSKIWIKDITFSHALETGAEALCVSDGRSPTNVTTKSLINENTWKTHMDNMRANLKTITCV